MSQNSLKQAVCIAYCPLFKHEPGTDMLIEYNNDFDELFEDISKYPNDAQAIIWVDLHEKITPVLVYDNALKVSKHLKKWSEGHPEEWFELAISKHNGSYMMILFPDINRCVDRFKLTQLCDGRDVTVETKVHVVTRPIAFRSNGEISMFKEVENMTELPLGLLDSKHFDPDNQTKIPVSKIKMLGTFNLEINPEHLDDFVRSSLDG